MSCRVLHGVLFCFLVLAASFFDLRKRIIPDCLCRLVFILGLCPFDPARLPGLLLGLPMLIAALLPKRPGRKKENIGGGDIKFTAAAGVVLGLATGAFGLLLGLSTASLWCAAMWFRQKCSPAKASAVMVMTIPLAPFLSLGFMAAYILNWRNPL